MRLNTGQINQQAKWCKLSCASLHGVLLKNKTSLVKTSLTLS
jgi:hypothetical protein